MQEDIWKELYNKAQSFLKPRTISLYIEAGGVSSAILTDKGNIYAGVCIDTSCSLGMCAERNAISNMITNGENIVTKLVCIGSKDNVMLPCGACREILVQLSSSSKDIEILTNINPVKVIKLSELVPDWWGKHDL